MIEEHLKLHGEGASAAQYRVSVKKPRAVDGDGVCAGSHHSLGFAWIICHVTERLASPGNSSLRHMSGSVSP